MRHLARIAAYPLAVLLLGVVAAIPRDVAANDGVTGPPLSGIALQSAFARENGLAPSEQFGVTGLQPGNPPAEQEPAHPAGPAITEVKVNQDYSQASQNETVIAINPTAPNMLIAGANDYRLGNPVGAAFYTSFDGGRTWNDGFPPFPLLAGEPKHDQGAQVNVQDTGGDPDAPSGKGGGGQLTEPPFGTGDPLENDHPPSVEADP